MSDPQPKASHLVVSPHLDDGVLSCGGTIHRLARRGQAVTVMTVMGGRHQGDLAETPILADLHQRWATGPDPTRARQLEDLRALRILGAAHHHLALVDCVYRQVDGEALYPSEASLFGAVHARDDAGDFLRERLPAAELAGQRLYLPLAVGNHVDHQIVRRWGLELLDAGWLARDILFYAEFPYSRDLAALDEALASIDLPLRVEYTALAPADARAKIAAIAAYRSQISTFWDSPAAMEAETRAWTRHPETGAYAERFWRLEAGAAGAS